MRLSQLTARLETLSPLAVLNRGYALVYLQNDAQNDTGERLLRSSAEIQPGQQIRARLASGSLQAQITATEITPPTTSVIPTNSSKHSESDS